MEEFRKHGVYKKAPIRVCIEMTRKQPIGVKWVDINMGGTENPEYRS